MALTSHHHVHPVRRAVGLLLLLGALIALLVVTWNHDRLGDRIGESFQAYYDRVGRHTVDR